MVSPWRQDDVKQRGARINLPDQIIISFPVCESDIGSDLHLLCASFETADS